MLVTNYEIKCNIGMPCRFAVVADLHNAECNEILTSLKTEKVDFILIPGDLLNSEIEKCPNSEKFIREAVKICPVFMSIGNHERNFSRESSIKAIEAYGVIVLDNAYCKHRNIIIAGLSSGFSDDNQGHFKRTPPPSTTFIENLANQSEFKILMSHHPEYYEQYIKEKNIDIIVSGHAHGGQIRFFGRGLFAPGQSFFPKYTQGVWDNRFIISRGLANTAFFPRINNKIELLYVNLSQN